MNLILPVAPKTEAIAINQLPTPALVVNAEVVRRNIKKLSHYTSQHGLGLRPHVKTHKSQAMARLLLEAGAIGLTAAKVGEVEKLKPATNDFLIAYPAIDFSRCQRIAKLSREITIRVAVDTEDAVHALAAAAQEAEGEVGILVDIDVGMGRTGVQSAEQSLKLAHLISSTKNIRLDGIMCYPGFIWAPIEKQAPLLAAVAAKLQEALELWAKNGLEARVVSGGSTPTAYQSHLIKQYTEIRPGTYLFNDLNTANGGYCTYDDCAARIICTVVSNAVKNQVIIDGGTKTLTSDFCLTARDSGHGYMVEYPEAKIFQLSEEHGQVDVSRCSRRPKIGERVTIIPNHICPCINLRDSFWWIEPDQLAYPIKVDARGELS